MKFLRRVKLDQLIFIIMMNALTKRNQRVPQIDLSDRVLREHCDQEGWQDHERSFWKSCSCRRAQGREDMVARSENEGVIDTAPSI